MIIKAVLTWSFIVDMCSGVIYHLNESEYERMPPLFGMDSNYRSCLRQPGGVYCTAQFELNGDPHNELVHTIREYSKLTMKHYNHSLIDRTICVTQSCKKFIQNKTLNEILELNLALEGCVNETIYTEYGLEAKLVNVISCDKHDDRLQIDLGDWILAMVLIFILAMNVIGSVYDKYMKNRNNKNDTAGNPYLLSFSIFRNWEKLTNTNTHVKYEQLNGIYGLKSIATFFVPVVHVIWLVGSGYTDNPREFEMSHDRLYYQIIFSGLVIVQIFFVISGCLLTFHLQVTSEATKLTWKDVPKILFYRWARLTPALALVILFTATWFRHLETGPLWKIFTTSVTTDCRIHWWRHLLYFNNYVAEDKYCNTQTWHVASEMQLFVVGLIIYMATASRGRYPAVAMLSLVGMIAPAMHVWLQDLDALVIMSPEFYRTFESDTFRSMHILGHNNLCCYAIGMAVGLVSYYCVKNKIEYTNNKLLKFTIWCIPLGIAGLFLSGYLFYVDGDRPHIVLRMLYAALQRPAIGIFTAIILLNLVLRFENDIRSFLEWRGWMVTSRLSYSVYLLHVNLIHFLMGIRTQLTHVSFFHVIINHFAVVSLTLVASVPFYLMFEAPMTSVAKIFLEVSSEPQQKKMK